MKKCVRCNALNPKTDTDAAKDAPTSALTSKTQLVIVHTDPTNAQGEEEANAENNWTVAKSTSGRTS